ncbi:MAG: transposase [Oscillospiraceae bacterium]|nr:transposase [Oscillospiraceae bacterium]
MDNPKRKRIRLTNFDYSSQTAYYLTICTKNRTPSLSRICVTEDRRIVVDLSPKGQKVQEYILGIPKHYTDFSLLSYIIMPDHIHLIVGIEQGDKPSSIPNAIKAFKRLTTKEFGEQIWQERYYDHVIRNEAELQTKIEYIETNPLRMLLKTGCL